MTNRNFHFGKDDEDRCRNVSPQRVSRKGCGQTDPPNSATRSYDKNLPLERALQRKASIELSEISRDRCDAAIKRQLVVCSYYA